MGRLLRSNAPKKNAAGRERRLRFILALASILDWPTPVHRSAWCEVCHLRFALNPTSGLWPEQSTAGKVQGVRPRAVHKTRRAQTERQDINNVA